MRTGCIHYKNSVGPVLAPEGNEWFLLLRERKQRRGKGASWHVASGSQVLVVMLQSAWYRHDPCFRVGFGLRDG